MSPLVLAHSLRERRVALVPTADGWRLRGPLAVIHAIAPEDLSTLRVELIWRRQAMRPQVPLTGPVLLLSARPGRHPAGCCWSCGERLLPGTNAQDRCLLCVEAAKAALIEARGNLERCEGTA